MVLFLSVTRHRFWKCLSFVWRLCSLNVPSLHSWRPSNLPLGFGESPNILFFWGGGNSTILATSLPLHSNCLLSIPTHRLSSLLLESRHCLYFAFSGNENPPGYFITVMTEIGLLLEIMVPCIIPSVWSGSWSHSHSWYWLKCPWSSVNKIKTPMYPFLSFWK